MIRVVPSPLESQRGSDDELVGRALASDAEAWARLCHQHFAAIHRHVGFLVHDADLADDLTQETFARALAGLHRFEAGAALRPWLRGIALNVVRKHWRAGERRTRALEAVRYGPPAPATDPDSALVRRRRAEALLAAVETLPDQLREVFVLVDMQGITPSDAAAELGITSGNCRVRATRARARIRRQLVKLGWMEEEAP